MRDFKVGERASLDIGDGKIVEVRQSNGQTLVTVKMDTWNRPPYVVFAAPEDREGTEL